MNVYQRYLDRGDHTYYGRFTALDPDHPGKTKRYLRKLVATTKADAVKECRGVKKLIDAGRFEQADETKLRHKKEIALATIFEHYPRGAHQLADRTVRENQNALRLVIRRARGLDDGANVDHLPVGIVDGALVRDYKAAAVKKVNSEDADDMREQQILRSANSILRQARSLFSKPLIEYYEDSVGLELPAGIRDFMEKPYFTRVGKTDYWPPADAIITTTFKALDKLQARGKRMTKEQRNRYLACWTALGAGLRKSEIAATRNDWFIMRDNVVWVRGDKLAKNGTVPDVRLQLGAWEKIRPFLAGKPGDFMITGLPSDREDTTFRRVSAWLRRLGWKTEKRIHEFRAFAGSKIAEAEGLLAAKDFLRHSSIATTEKYYMRYLRMKNREVKLVLPSTPAIATPVLAVVNQ